MIACVCVCVEDGMTEANFRDTFQTQGYFIGPVHLATIGCVCASVRVLEGLWPSFGKNCTSLHICPLLSGEIFCEEIRFFVEGTGSLTLSVTFSFIFTIFVCIHLCVGG